MSPSIIATRLPIWLSAIARFTATVVLPTPPLPAPTAMMFFTPGTGAFRQIRRRGRSHLRRHLHVHAGNARHCCNRRPRLIAHLILHRTSRRRQLDRECHAVPVDAKILDELQRDDVSVRSGSRTERRASRTSASVMGISRLYSAPSFQLRPSLLYSMRLGTPSALARRLAPRSAAVPQLPSLPLPSSPLPSSPAPQFRSFVPRYLRQRAI